MSSSLFLGIDIGGTKTELLVADGKGVSHHQHRMDTQTNNIEGLAEAIRLILADYPIEAIGIGCPGFVDTRAGVVRGAVNLGWDEMPLLEKLSATLPDLPPLFIENDVNLIALGEYYFTRPFDDFIYLAIGTGLGAAAILNGRVHHGVHFSAMELGHLRLLGQTRLCRCGQRGCAETLLSGTGFMGGLAEHKLNFPESRLSESATPEDIINAIPKHDPLAEQILRDAKMAFQVICEMAMVFFDPQAIIIGGGLGHAILDWLTEDLNAFFYKSPLTIPQVLRSELQSTSLGGIALAALALDKGETL